MWKLAFGFIPSIIKTFSNFKNMNDIYKNLQQQQKNVTLFHLGHWVRLKVGGTPFIVRRKTLNKYSNSILSGIAHDDKISTKTLTDIFSKPTSVLEGIMHDDEVSKESSPPPSESESNKNNNKPTSSTSTHYPFDKNNNLPTIIIDPNKKHNQEQEELYKKHHHHHHHHHHHSGENDEFDIAINENGEKKLKFEKDHDGFYLIDRDPQYFNVILNFLRTGKVSIPSSLDIECLIADSKFYRLYDLEMILNDKIKEEKRNLERIEIYKSEFNYSYNNGTSNIGGSSNNRNELFFILPMQWFESWKRFIDGDHLLPSSFIETTQFFKTIDGLPINSLKDNLILDIDYICVSKETFLTFSKYYKIIGPIIMRQSRNIYDNPPPQFISSKIWNIK